jgi:hypothetical protein
LQVKVEGEDGGGGEDDEDREDDEAGTEAARHGAGEFSGRGVPAKREARVARTGGGW